MPLYLTCVVKHPTEEQSKNGELETMIIDPAWLIAANEEAARSILTISASKNENFDPNRCSILVAEGLKRFMQKDGAFHSDVRS